MSKQIRCCTCGNPLISTFIYSGAEYYCIDCGSSYGFFDGYKDVDETQELNKRGEENLKWFLDIRKDLIGGGMKIRGCKKCDEGGYHLHHASDDEIKKHKEAEKKLSERINK